MDNFDVHFLDAIAITSCWRADTNVAQLVHGDPLCPVSPMTVIPIVFAVFATLITDRLRPLVLIASSTSFGLPCELTKRENIWS